MALTIVSLVLILASLPLSLFCVVKVVQVRNLTSGLIYKRICFKRNMKEQSSFVWEDYLQEELGDLVYFL